MSRSNRQESNALVERIHRHKGARFQMRSGGANRAKHGCADGGREHVLRTDLNDTWSIRLVSCEQHSEIQIVRENDIAVGDGELQNLALRRRGLADGRPVNCRETVDGPERNPERAQVHID